MTGGADDPLQPLCTFLIAVDGASLALLAGTLDSLESQTLPDWEAVVVTSSDLTEAVLEATRTKRKPDRRVRVMGHRGVTDVAAQLNNALTRAKGEFIALLDPGDHLADEALATLGAAVVAAPESDFLYSDETWTDAIGSGEVPFRKPDWSPERLRCQFYTGRLALLRTALVRELGCFRGGFEGAEEYELTLRLSEAARTVTHVRRALCTRRGTGRALTAEGAWTSGAEAVQQHLERSAVDATARCGDIPGTYVLERAAVPAGLVSVVIPTRGTTAEVWGQPRALVVEAVRSLIAHAGPVSLEIIVVHDLETPAEVLTDLRELAADRLVLIPYDKAFNFSEKCNLGALAAHGRWLIMMNDDVQVISPDFVQTLVAPLFEGSVGMTGARLLFADGTIQHAGVVYRGGRPAHAFYQERDDHTDIGDPLVVNRECSALTGACIAVRRTDFEAVGGFSEDLPGSYNDVDFSRKIAGKGLRLIWLAHTRAYHFDSKTRDPQTHQWERDILARRCSSDAEDPYLPAI